MNFQHFFQFFKRRVVEVECQDDEELVDVLISSPLNPNAQSISSSLSQDGNLTHMMNPEILSHVFEVCELRDVFNYRLVCKLWHSLSLTRFRNEATMLLGVSRWKPYMLMDEEGEFHCQDELEGLAIEECPFRSYHLSGFEFGKDPTRPGSFHLRTRKNWDNNHMRLNLVHFFTKYGNNMHKLKLSNAVLVSMKFFQKVDLNIKELNDLEELSVNSIVIVKSGFRMEDSEEYTEFFLSDFLPLPHGQNRMKIMKSSIVNFVLPIAWHSIFTHCPNLEKLDIRLCELPRIRHDLENLSSGNMDIKELRVNFLGSSLLTLSDVEDCVETLLNLPLAHFQLERVSIDASRWRDGFNIASLIERHASTLTKFSMSVREKLAVQSHFFAGTETGNSLNLTELHLQGYACPDFHFLEQLPHLKILRLEKCYSKMIQETVLGRLESMTRLPHLYFFEVGLTLNAEEVKVFAKVMPHVEILKICLKTEGFRVVCRKWKSLRELELRSLSEREASQTDAVGDEGLTGIVDGCAELLPNITDLQQLQHLCIRSEGRISDSSVWNGFLELPNLRSLSVALAKETSDEAFDALLAHLPNRTGSEITRK